MFRGLYTATSAMQTNQIKLDVVTNNIANANTNGFKKDLVISQAFPEKLISKIHGNLAAEPNSNEPMEITRDGNGFYLSTSKGFFTVDTPMGKSYNRSVRFATDSDGYVKTYTRDIEKGIDTTMGSFVLDKSGNKIKAPSKNISVNNNGQLLSNGQVVADLIYNPPKNVIGTINGGLRLDRIATNFTEGQLNQTSNKLDFAIKGEGFFQVQTPNGLRYTRDGAFEINNKGQLVTSKGDIVLGEKGPITLKNDFTMQTDGRLFDGNTLIDKLKISNITNVNALRKEGENLYKVEDNVNIQTKPFDGEVVQGFLENSNVNTINEMVDMITVFREYESGQKVIKAYDDMLSKAVNEIGKV